MAGKRSIIPIERLDQRILLIRGHKVMLDADLAQLYGVTTFNLNKAVKRNLPRFPDDFMFQLTPKEHRALTFQTGISKTGGRGGRRYRPYVFTEHGVAMLSSVLRSERAIQVNIAIMRAFARFRQFLAAHKELADKLAELERKLVTHDREIQTIFEAIRQLMAPPDRLTRQIGFRTEGDKPKHTKGKRR